MDADASDVTTFPSGIEVFRRKRCTRGNTLISKPARIG